MTQVPTAPGSAPKDLDDRADRPRRFIRIAPQLGIEIVIGLVLASLLVIVGWASSNAIRFVYGGY